MLHPFFKKPCIFFPIVFSVPFLLKVLKPCLELYSLFFIELAISFVASGTNDIYSWIAYYFAWLHSLFNFRDRIEFPFANFLPIFKEFVHTSHIFQIDTLVFYWLRFEWFELLEIPSTFFYFKDTVRDKNNFFFIMVWISGQITKFSCFAVSTLRFNPQQCISIESDGHF